MLQYIEFLNINIFYNLSSHYFHINVYIKMIYQNIPETKLEIKMLLNSKMLNLFFYFY